MQHTLKSQVSFKGKGLHSGVTISMLVAPAPVNQGITFIRQDVEKDHQKIHAVWDNVEASQLCTKIKNEHEISVSTIEHLMAAFAGMGIDNAIIYLDGPEVPIMDGSAMPFIRAFEQTGLIAQNSPRKAIRILKTVEIKDNDGRMACFEPDISSVFTFSIDFDNQNIGEQSATFELMEADDFKTQLAFCRTFTQLREVETLMKAGLIKGGGLDNAVVFDDDKILNPEGLRHAKEPVRHKLLDAIGDTYLAGAPIIGRFTSHKGGHALTNKLLRKLFDDTSTYVETIDHLGIGKAEQFMDSKNPAYNA
jgi:UDP-3-O-[3-hydroxymyristoyl] N-acetylglucosamine deacetylase